ncbi:hypothetical protein IFM89_018857 [Coptis chinensis]|uniref:Uncharacterized protein n=1 Tax=Coptis chinensis TaxID=261450 RepID=A0A835HWT8_9MAGN|nr:hypothetical protein IFM89_018857 [Coptis chinensis]
MRSPANSKGQAIIRAIVAWDVVALMEYKGFSLEEAAAYVAEECVPKGNVGLVTVSAIGEVTMPFNTMGMEDGYSDIKIRPYSVHN